MLKIILKNKNIIFIYLRAKITLKNMNVGGRVIAFGSLKWLRSPYHEWLKRVLNMASQHMSK
jgi:hypothetical protein